MSPPAKRPQLRAGQRSLDYLRKRGWEAEIMEKFITHGGTAQQQTYIDALLGQRARLIDLLRKSCSLDEAVMQEARHFLDKLKEPQPPVGIGGYRKDPFGFMDILAFGGNAILAVQTTSRAQITAHLRKYRQDPEVRDKIRKWLVGPAAFHVHGWQRVELPTKTGGTKIRWQVHVREVFKEDLSTS